MKNAIQSNADLRKLGELIDGIEIAMLTTHAADGSMVSRPLQTLQLAANGELMFFTAADSQKISKLARRQSRVRPSPCLALRVSVRPHDDRSRPGNDR